jgi:hypothetical protein
LVVEVGDVGEAVAEDVFAGVEGPAGYVGPTRLSGDGAVCS